jgi:hypothetical protein
MQSRLRQWVFVALSVGVLVTVGAVWSWPFSTAEEWSALAAWGTATVALIAGGVAVGQLGEARRLREEQAQPYVVAYMEPSVAGAYFMDLVVRNFGTTAAHDVRLRIDPAPRRAAGTRGDVWPPDSIPVLVPGQEWRTLWDCGARVDSGLPDHHEAAISVRTPRGPRSLPSDRSSTSARTRIGRTLWSTEPTMPPRRCAPSTRRSRRGIAGSHRPRRPGLGWRHR